MAATRKGYVSIDISATDLETLENLKQEGPLPLLLQNILHEAVKIKVAPEKPGIKSFEVSEYDLQCPVTASLFINAVQIGGCGHCIEASTVAGVRGPTVKPVCPSCRGEMWEPKPVPALFNRIIESALTQSRELRNDLKSSVAQMLDDNAIRSLQAKKTIALLKQVSLDLTEEIIEAKGKYKDKSLAEILVTSKLGRQLLMRDEALKNLIPAGTVIAERSVEDWLKPPEKSARDRLFVPAAEETEDLSTFLRHVAQGKQDEAEEILQKNPDLLFMESDVTDYSDRKFERTSGLKLALWARDRHMREMMENYFGDNEAAVKQQVQELECHGLVYVEGGVECRTSAFSFEQLKQAYQAYVEYDREHGHEYTPAVNATFRRLWLQVGMAQRMALPHVLQEYCRPDRTFMLNDDYDNPVLRDFKEEVLDRQAKYWGGYVVYPFRRDFQLGEDFGIYRGAGNEPVRAPRFMRPAPSRAEAAVDLAAISRLCKVRNDEYLDFTRALGLTADIHPGR